MAEIGIRFGGPDRASIRCIASFPSGLYISPLVDNSDPTIHQFLRERYFENGAALFGRESSDEMADFREAAKFEATDQQTIGIIQYFVQRVRNYAHIETLMEAEIEFARSVPNGCGHPEARILVADAMMKLTAMRKMTHEIYGRHIFGQNIGFPPFDLTCRCRMEGVIEGLDY